MRTTRMPAMLAGIALLFTGIGILVPVEAQAPSFKLKELMRAADFERCGLQKLSPAELRSLEVWVTGFTRQASAKLARDSEQARREAERRATQAAQREAEQKAQAQREAELRAQAQREAEQRAQAQREADRREAEARARIEESTMCCCYRKYNTWGGDQWIYRWIDADQCLEKYSKGLDTYYPGSCVNRSNCGR